jgi:MFS transporter, PPP family, 3-phenylpropionic acid transporter
VKGIARRLSFAQASSGMVSGIFTPFFGAWLAWRGVPVGQIAFILSSGFLLRVIAGPLTGIVADARNDRRETMLFLYWLSLAGYAALGFLNSGWSIAFAAIAATVASGVATPLMESVSVRLAEHYGYHYGRVRLWASSAFILFNVVGGVCMWKFGTGAIAYLLGGTAALCVIATSQLPSPPKQKDNSDFFLEFGKTFRESGELMRSGQFLLFLAASSLAQGSHAFYYGYGGLHWRALGYSGVMIGLIWPLGVFAEVALLMFSHRVLRVLKPAQLLFWGAAACAVRWTILAFDPPLGIVLIAQFMHGFTFALTHLGAMFFILRAIPHRLSATAQSLYFVCSTGAVMGTATLASGIVYADYGGRAYLMMSVMGLTAMGFALLLGRAWHGGRIVDDGDEERIYTI